MRGGFPGRERPPASRRQTAEQDQQRDAAAENQVQRHTALRRGFAFVCHHVGHPEAQHRGRIVDPQANEATCRMGTGDLTEPWAMDGEEHQGAGEGEDAPRREVPRMRTLLKRRILSHRLRPLDRMPARGITTYTDTIPASHRVASTPVASGRAGKRKGRTGPVFFMGAILPVPRADPCRGPRAPGGGAGQGSSGPGIRNQGTDRALRPSTNLSARFSSGPASGSSAPSARTTSRSGLRMSPMIFTHRYTSIAMCATIPSP